MKPRILYGAADSISIAATLVYIFTASSVRDAAPAALASRRMRKTRRSVTIMLSEIVME